MEKDFYIEQLPIPEGEEVVTLENGEKINVTLENYADFSLSNCWSLDPLTICVRQDGNKIKLCFKVSGAELGCATIAETSPCVKWAGSKGPIKVSLKVCAKFKEKKVVAEGKVCVFAACAKFKKTIFDW